MTQLPAVVIPRQSLAAVAIPRQSLSAVVLDEPVTIPPKVLATLWLDFIEGDLWVAGTGYASIDLAPGYAFTRSGEQGAIDSDATVDWFAANAPAINGTGYHAFGALTNLLLNAGDSASLSTQTVSMTAVQHTLYFRGTGSVTLSGAATGTLNGTGANDMVALVFTPSAGNVTFTVSGTVQYANLVAGNFPSGGPLIRTAGATASIGAGTLAHTLAALADQDQLIFARFEARTLGADQGIFQFDDGTNNNRVALYIASTNVFVAIVRSGAALVYSASGGTAVIGQEATLVLRRLSGAWRTGTYIAGILTWLDAGGAAVIPSSMTISRPAKVGTAADFPLRGDLLFGGIRPGTFADDAAVIAAIQETE